MCELCGGSSLQVILPKERKILPAKVGQNLLDVLRAHQVGIPALCSGRGSCGKCRVLVDGQSVLACAVTLTHDVVVALPSIDAGFVVLQEQQASYAVSSPQAGFGFAIDIGTTTVALQLLKLEDGSVCGTHAFVNRQRQFGADVIARIQATSEGHLEQLRRLITDDLLRAFRTLLENAQVPPEQVARVVIAGNTTMLYLLLGLPCESLGAFPFEPAFAWESEYAFERVFCSDFLRCPVVLAP